MFKSIQSESWQFQCDKLPYGGLWLEYVFLGKFSVTIPCCLINRNLNYYQDYLNCQCFKSRLPQRPYFPYCVQSYRRCLLLTALKRTHQLTTTAMTGWQEPFFTNQASHLPTFFYFYTYCCRNLDSACVCFLWKICCSNFRTVSNKRHEAFPFENCKNFDCFISFSRKNYFMQYLYFNNSTLICIWLDYNCYYTTSCIPIISTAVEVCKWHKKV